MELRNSNDKFITNRVSKTFIEIYKMGRFWLQKYQPTLILELNFKISWNHITD